MSSSAQIIVTGFHRSGTSMAMQALKKAGLHIGDSLIGAAPSNPDGHFEDIDTVKLHDRWLTAAGMDWCCTEQPPPISPNEASRGIEPISRRLATGLKPPQTSSMQTGSTQTHWGLKDPRAALYLNQWFDTLSNPYAVLVYRHYASCATSIQRRQADTLLTAPSTDTDNLRFWADPSLALRSWLVHNQALLHHLQTQPTRCVLVAQEAQIAGANISSIVTNKLPIDLQVESATGVDKTKASNQKSITLHSPQWKEALDATWQQLQAMADAPAPNFPEVNWETPVNTDTHCADGDNDNAPLELAIKALHDGWDKLGVPRASGIRQNH